MLLIKLQVCTDAVIVFIHQSKILQNLTCYILLDLII
jgi:hypothetical protein